MRLRVVSYNIHRAIGVDRRFRPERIVAILAKHDADIALLQEVDEGAPRSRELNLAREIAHGAGYPHWAVGHNVTLRKGRYGNATLSRHPILRERNIDLTVGMRKRRGCQHTVVSAETGGRRRRLEIFNLHLGLSARERAEQIAILARSGEFTSLAPSVACIVGGDFNDWRSLLHPVLTGMLRMRSALDASRGDRPIPTFPSFFPRGPLDRIYFRGGLRLMSAARCRHAISTVASDHRPIVADFVIE